MARRLHARRKTADLDAARSESRSPGLIGRHFPGTEMPALEGNDGHLARCWIPPAQRAEARFRAAHPDSLSGKPEMSRAGR